MRRFYEGANCGLPAPCLAGNLCPPLTFTGLAGGQFSMGGNLGADERPFRIVIARSTDADRGDRCSVSRLRRCRHL